MQAGMDARIPICLITGFLGCGKTTLLKHIARRTELGKLVFLVNEFSPRDIDGALVAAEADRVVTIPGGSIFCKCLVTEFIAQLTALPARFGTPDGVVIEASGMANPSVMGQMLTETRLDSVYRLSRVVSVVDPGSFMKLRHVLPNVVVQVESADILVLNKVDLYPPDFLTETRAVLRALNADARLLEGSYGAVDCAWLPADTTPRCRQGAYAPCRDPLYRSATIEPKGEIELDALRRRIEDAAGSLYRLKGFVRHPEGIAYVDFSHAGLRITPARGGAPGLAIIFHGGDKIAPALEALLAWLRKT